MKDTRISKLIVEIIALVLIFLFVYTGVSKILEHNSFRSVLRESPAIKSKANFFAWIIPLTEIITALLLLVPAFRMKGLMLSLILLIMFTSYISYMVLFIPNLTCSCGGVIKEMSWRQHLGFNLFFIIISIVGILLQQRTKDFIAINRQSRKPV